ncbi:MAG: sialidase family protein [Bacteroidota bacterium]
MNKQIFVGTSKGLVVFNKNDNWRVESIHFAGFPVTQFFIDRRNHTWWVGISHNHWGQKLHRSFDQGKSWEEVKTPKFTVNYSPGQLARLNKIWTMESAGLQDSKGLWLGTEPGALFYSDDLGNHFELVESLWNHPSRQNQNQWFATGSKYPFLHSIQVNPRDENHLYVAISCAGVFESKDKGRSWTPKNSGLIAAYLPEPHVEIGHDPHLLLMAQKNPSVLWQQNHCGIFRSENGGQDWALVSDPNAIPHYGFPIAINGDGNEAWVIPAKSDEQRIPNQLQLKVFHTYDNGALWNDLSEGLPDNYAFDLVLRHAFKKHNDTLAFGTTNGNLYIKESVNAWKCITTNLTKISVLVLD